MNESRLVSIEEEEAKFFKYMEIPYPYNLPSSNWSSNIDKTKILSLADPHCPYVAQFVLYIAEERHRDAAILVVPGDVGDYYSKSRFRKTRHQAFKDELRSVFRFIEWAATNWSDVRLMIGNHDPRPEKQISNIFAGNTELLIMTEQNLLGRLASYFDNVRARTYNVMALRGFSGLCS